MGLKKSDLYFKRNGWIVISWWQGGERHKKFFDDIDLAWEHIKQLRSHKIHDIYCNS